MRKLRKRISLILLMVMLCSLTPYQALAADATGARTVDGTEALTNGDAGPAAAVEIIDEAAATDPGPTPAEEPIEEIDEEEVTAAPEPDPEPVEEPLICETEEPAAETVEEPTEEPLATETEEPAATETEDPAAEETEEPKAEVVEVTAEEVEKETEGDDVLTEVQPETEPEEKEAKEADVAGDAHIVTVVKEWDDNNNEAGKRPDAVLVQLLMDGTVVEERVLTEASTATVDGETKNWAYTWTNLQAKENGEWIEYKVVEVQDESLTNAGYALKKTSYNYKDETTTVDTTTSTVRSTVFTIINEYQYMPSLTDVSVGITWDDNDNADGVRPDSITVTLTADGGAVKDNPKTAVLNEANSWQYTWTGLDKADGEKVITYAVDEGALPTGYQRREISSSTTTDKISFTIKNIRTAPASIPVNASASVTWVDADNIDGARPASIKLILKADGAVADERTLNDGTLNAEWSDLTRYNSAGNEIKYTLEVADLGNYITQINSKKVTGTTEVKYTFAITNTHAERPVSICKVDKDTGAGVAGAKLQVLDKDGYIIVTRDSAGNNTPAEWTTTDSGAHVVHGLTPGETYTLHEAATPDGYIIPADVTFSVADDGTVTCSGSVESNTVYFKAAKKGEPAPAAVTASAIDTDGTQVGASYQILDEAGNVVDKWTGTSEGHSTSGLKLGEKYILREVTNPTGYTITVDTTFTLDASGNVVLLEKVTRTVKLIVAPGATTSFKAVAAANGKGFKLTWARVSNATGYVIYRNNKKIKTVGNVATFTDTKANTNGAKYTYKIYAKNSAGVSTAFKSVVIYKLARPAVKSLKNSASKKMTVKWAKNKKATGYQIQYSLKKTFKSSKTVKITKKATVSRAIAKLKKGKTYYVRIRTYKKVGKKVYYSAWSAAKKVKIKN